MLGGILVNKHLAEDDIIDKKKSLHRKYLDWRILHFGLRKKVDIESWIDTGTKQKKKPSWSDGNEWRNARSSHIKFRILVVSKICDTLQHIR